MIRVNKNLQKAEKALEFLNDLETKLDTNLRSRLNRNRVLEIQVRANLPQRAVPLPSLQSIAAQPGESQDNSGHCQGTPETHEEQQCVQNHNR